MSVLPGVKRVIYLNAGHLLSDPGAIYNGVTESSICMKIRDAVVPVLRERGYVVEAVPDELNLSKSIAWVNAKAPNLNDGLALDIHLNAGATSTRGTEAFYGSSATSKRIAEAISRRLSKSLGTANRGAKPDTETAVGSLGWIRQTKVWSTLVEVCFLTNDKDMLLLRGEGGYHKTAVGIADGIDELFGVQPLPGAPSVPVENTSVEIPVPPVPVVPAVQPESKPSLAQYTIAELLKEVARRVAGMGK